MRDLDDLLRDAKGPMPKPRSVLTGAEKAAIKDAQMSTVPLPQGTVGSLVSAMIGSMLGGMAADAGQRAVEAQALEIEGLAGHLFEANPARSTTDRECQLWIHLDEIVKVRYREHAQQILRVARAESKHAAEQTERRHVVQESDLRELTVEVQDTLDTLDSLFRQREWLKLDASQLESLVSHARKTVLRYLDAVKELNEEST